jgi:uncharacterized membrane protein YhaH (DUF805 family)
MDQMLDWLFGFNARLGRLHFLLSLVCMFVAWVATDFAISRYVIQHTPSGAKPSNVLAWLSLIGFSWIRLNLKSMRIRDMGWDPVYIMPIWTVMVIVDGIVSIKIPAWSMHRHHITTVGLAVQVIFIMLLLLWPSEESKSATPAFSGSQAPAKGPAARLARATGAGFGRRGS